MAMKKIKLILFSIIILLFFALLLPASAENAAVPRLSDQAELLSAKEEAALSRELE